MIAELFAKLLGTDEVGVVDSAMKTLVVRVGGAALALLFNAIVARSLGADGTGIYFLAFAIITVCSMVSRFGLDTAVIKVVGRDHDKQDSGAMRGLYRGSASAVLAIGCVIAAATWLFAPEIAERVFDRLELTGALRHLAPAIPLLALLNVQAAFFLGIHRASAAISLQNVLVPAIAIAMMLVVLEPSDPKVVSTTYSLSVLLACGAGMLTWYLVSGPGKGRPSYVRIPELLSIAPAMLMAKFMNRIVMRWVAVILLGYWASSGDVGQFAVATRLTLVMSFALVVANAVVAPRIARQFSEGDISGMARVGSLATRMALVLSSPVIVIFLVFPDWTMSLFGSEFRSAAPILVILAIGEVVNVLTGPVGFLLQMTNHEKDFRNCTVLGALSQLLLCILLIPKNGAIGAAVAMALSLAVTNLSAIGYVWIRLGIIPVPVISSRLSK